MCKLAFSVRMLVIITALWDQQYDTGGQLQGDLRVQNKHYTGKPILSVYPYSSVIMWHGHSHKLHTMLKTDFFF